MSAAFALVVAWEDPDTGHVHHEAYGPEAWRFDCHSHAWDDHITADMDHDEVLDLIERMANERDYWDGELVRPDTPVAYSHGGKGAVLPPFRRRFTNAEGEFAEVAP